MQSFPFKTLSIKSAFTPIDDVKLIATAVLSLCCCHPVPGVEDTLAKVRQGHLYSVESPTGRFHTWQGDIASLTQALQSL